MVLDKLRLSAKATLIAVIAALALLAMIYSLSFGGWKALSVQTGSMQPAIDPGDLVLVKRVPASDIRIGDVITYINPSDKAQTITHRVIGVNQLSKDTRTFITRGDANAKQDAAVHQSRIVGVVNHQVPFAGKAVDFMRTIPGLILIIYIPALAIICSELRRLTAFYKSQMPFVTAGYMPRGQRHSKIGGAKFAFIGILGAAAIIIPVASAFAALQAQATLTGNTIASVEPDQPDPEPPTPPQQSTCTVTNNNNVSMQSQNSQSATSGNANVSDNTNGESAASGDASNSNNTNVQVNINNQSPCPQQ